MKFIVTLLLLIIPFRLFAAIGCNLHNIDKNVRDSFPNYTKYKVENFNIKNRGGEKLLKKIEEEFGDKFYGVYESIETNFSIYTIYKDKKILGYIFGVNQKEKFEPLQVFIVYNINKTIKNFFYQKLSSKKAELLKTQEFADQFKGLSYKDFKNYNPQDQTGFVNKIKLTKEAIIDYYNTLRAIKKNMILLEIFLKK